ncbi:MAG: hypothetical protein E7Z86_05805 [Methanosphaera stadtmanae]|nr:hypothetical protein [Methanosphaera stadtmanae]
MVNHFVRDEFPSADDGDNYFDFLEKLQDEIVYLQLVIDEILSDNLFNNNIYIQLTGMMRYAKNRIFPVFSAFLAEDPNFNQDIYYEFMDIHLMVNYLFDKLQYEIDEVVIKWDFNNAEIKEDIDNLETVNYYLNLIQFQISLFAGIYDSKVSLIEGKISQEVYDDEMESIHKILDDEF